jgi:hypothetical protein
MTVTASAHQKGITPYEHWHKRKPNIANLHPFRCVGYVKVPDEIRTKLDSKAVKMYLVGYTSDAHYRMWDPEKNRIVIAQHVIFEGGINKCTVPATPPDVLDEELQDFMDKPQHDIDAVDNEPVPLPEPDETHEIPLPQVNEESEAAIHDIQHPQPDNAHPDHHANIEVAQDPNAHIPQQEHHKEAQEHLEPP